MEEESRGARPLPFRAEHVQVLDWYVTECEAQQVRASGREIGPRDTARVRHLANRIAEMARGFVTEDGATFSAADVALLAAIAERLTAAESVAEGAPPLADPVLTSDSERLVRHRLAMGQIVLEVRDRVGQHIRQ